MLLNKYNTAIHINTIETVSNVVNRAIFVEKEIIKGKVMAGESGRVLTPFDTNRACVLAAEESTRARHDDARTLAECEVERTNIISRLPK